MNKNIRKKIGLNGNLPSNLSPEAQEAFNKLLPDLSKQ
jgi:hypothetical protein